MRRELLDISNRIDEIFDLEEITASHFWTAVLQLFA
jgi:hypothetical protein